MMLEIAIWSLLIAIGVSDAQDNRISNKAVLLLLVMVTANVMYVSESNGLDHLYSGVVTFAVCFILYLLKVMAGGDVKLLAVLGFWLGPESMSQAVPLIIVSGGVVGLFYLAQHLASSRNTFGEQIKAYAVQKVTPGWKNNQRMVIPFAPAIVIGLAYYFYIH
ncbi:prepilin peptidase [Vibrio natriegens]|uniref:A24 family peptidase n=1 Tax=Vibrio natriegens TaxID=691 RepID=UPI001594E4E6|nr:A24 family peptidase [Vibrio natriegens]NVC93798.1 prepilin peptidase [Vibrio natriegens]